MPDSCDSFPIGPEAIRAWVRRHADDLPETLPELSRLPIPFRRAVVAAVAPAVRLSLWEAHLASFLEEESGLSGPQRAVVRDAVADFPAIFGGDPSAGQERMRALEARMREVFTREEAGRIFGTLGPPEPPGGLPLPPDAAPEPAA
jgi:hypothetical protein